jgi:acyl-CoA dehydrogenase
VSACALMRRGLALAHDFAERREAFGRPIAHHPLHADTLVGLDAAFQGALHLTFRVAELLGRSEGGDLDGTGKALLRALTPIAKLTTARQAITVVSECLEAFGGAGYVEDTGLPSLLRDVQVLSIWEGTTNVLALDTLRALSSGGMEALREEAERCAAVAKTPELRRTAERAREVFLRAESWRAETLRGEEELQAGARRLAMTLGLALEVLLLAHHAEWEMRQGHSRATSGAARRLLADGIDRIHPPS